MPLRVAACADSSSNSAFANHKHCEWEKRKCRLEKNRKAARESRKRKKMHIEDIKKELESLTREHLELKRQNEVSWRSSASLSTVLARVSRRVAPRPLPMVSRSSCATSVP